MTGAYIMLRKKPVPITEILSVESRYFAACLATELDGEVPVKIKSRCLQKALEFCEKRAYFRKEFSSNGSIVAFFDRKFLKDVKESKIDLVDLIHAAGRLDITNLFNLLFEDVVDIIFEKTPEEVEKIFKIRLKREPDWCYYFMKDVLDFAPPCPTLYEYEQKEMKLHPFLMETLRVPPSDFKNLSVPRKQYWVYAHLVIKRNPAKFIDTHQLSKEDAAGDDEEDDEEEESKVHNWLGLHPHIKFNPERKMAAYIMLRGDPVPVTEIHSLESRYFAACLATEFDGEIPIKIKSRCLEKALEFCEKRPSSPSKDDFDLQFLKDVRKCKLDLIDLIHAAGKLGINNLVNLLFNDVVCILCDKAPEQLEMIFKVRYNGDYLFCSLINELLDFPPPCPTLYIREQEDVKLYREEILKVSPADFKTLPPPRKQYWVYAHLVIKCNTAMFIEIHEDAAEEAAKEEESEEEESKVPKNDDGVRLEKKTTG